MAMQIDCYLSFNGNAEEALNFYAQCLGGKANLMRFDSAPKDSGMDVPPGFEPTTRSEFRLPQPS